MLATSTGGYSECGVSLRPCAAHCHTSVALLLPHEKMPVDKTEYAVLVTVAGIVYSLGEAYKDVPALDFGTDEAYLPVTVLPRGLTLDPASHRFVNDDVWNKGFLKGEAKIPQPIHQLS